MTNMQHTKVNTGAIKSVCTETCKSFASIYGLLMLAVPLIVGGGLFSLLMKRLSMEDIGFFILQPVFLTTLVMMTLTQYKMNGKILPLKYHIRNLVVTLVTGILATLLLVLTLWCFSIYVPTANSATVEATQVPMPFVIEPATNPPGLLVQFPVYFNMYSLVTFTAFLVFPMMLMFIGAVVRCEGSLLGHFKCLFLAVFRNVSILIAVSLLALVVFALWSYTSIHSDWLIYMAVFPIAFFTAVIHRIAVLSLPQGIKY